MRKIKGGVLNLANQIEEELSRRDLKLSLPQRRALSDISASILSCQSVNTTEIANILPRDTDAESRYRYINRVLKNERISPLKVMCPLVKEVIEYATDHEKTAIIMMDQSKIADDFECLMISLRCGKRALPLCWSVLKTKGGIGWKDQKILLDCFKDMIPPEKNILFTADRFYGTSMLVDFCKTQKWSYRIRLKGNLIFQHEGGDITALQAHKSKISSLKHAYFNQTDISTNIALLQEAHHNEPWFIAMDINPNQYRALDYGMRWGIEALFSDFKSRGFGITKTQLECPKRIEKLILLLSIATYWAVSTGLYAKHREAKKKT